MLDEEYMAAKLEAATNRGKRSPPNRKKKMFMADLDKRFGIPGQHKEKEQFQNSMDSMAKNKNYEGPGPALDFGAATIPDAPRMVPGPANFGAATIPDAPRMVPTMPFAKSNSRQNVHYSFDFCSLFRF